MNDLSKTFRIVNGVGFIGHRPIENAKVIVEDLSYTGYMYKRRQILCEFKNGWALSILFGTHSYSENHGAYDGSVPFVEESLTAEVGVFNRQGSLVDVWNHGDTVKGWVSTDEAWELYQRIENFEEVNV